MFEICRTSVRPTVLVFGSALLLAGVPGCGSGIPKTYPVKGKIVWKGGKPVEDGRIEFQSLSDPDLKAVGEIGPDGTFSLSTYKEGKARPGAVAGQHKVVIEPDMGDGEPAMVVVLPNPYTVEPKENDFTIEIAPRRR